ncbi:MAG: CpaD family pilus assembly protein [Novosphingobium sp.]
MTMTIHSSAPFKTGRTIALALALAGLAGCGSGSSYPVNRSLESVHQPVVQHTNYTFDVATGVNGLSVSERRRLASWFEAMDLHYGDRIAIDDPLANPATRADVEQEASRYGMMLADSAPTTPGYVNAGTARVVIIRSTASVKGCPDWGTKSDFNMNNATSTGYGCAINGNLAAMVANPDHLIEGVKGTSETVVVSSSKAIETFRAAQPTGAGGLKATSSDGK